MGDEPLHLCAHIGGSPVVRPLHLRPRQRKQVSFSVLGWVFWNLFVSHYSNLSHSLQRMYRWRIFLARFFGLKWKHNFLIIFRRSVEDLEFWNVRKRRFFRRSRRQNLGRRIVEQKNCHRRSRRTNDYVEKHHRTGLAYNLLTFFKDQSQVSLLKQALYKQQNSGFHFTCIVTNELTKTNFISVN